MQKRLSLLKTESDFEKNKFRKIVNSASFRIRIFLSPNQNSPRFGFIVPKKVLPKVTDRNKVKRRIKSILRSSLIKIKPADIIYFPNRNALLKKYNDLEQEIVYNLRKSDLWKA